MADLLASASLLLTLIALLYGLWYPEIVQALAIVVEPHAQDRVQDHQRAKDICAAKAVPLAIAAVALTVVFAPETFKIAIRSADRAFVHGWSSVLDYDAAAMSLVLVTVGSAFFAWHLVALARRLHLHVRRLDPKSGDL